MLRFLEPIDYADVPPGQTKLGPLAYTLFVLRGSGFCESTFRAPAGECFRDGKTADAVYGADRACTTCVADAALKAGGFLIDEFKPARSK